VKYELVKISKCKMCGYRRNSTNPNTSLLGTNDVFRCYHPAVSGKLLGRVEIKTFSCPSCGSRKTKEFINNIYKGDFPEWCPLMDHSDLVSKVLNIPKMKNSNIWQTSWEDGSSWEADDDIKKFTVIFDIYTKLNPISRQILLTKLLEI